MNKVLNLPHIQKEHIASHCVCCGSDILHYSPAILMPFLAHRIYGWAPIEIDDSWGLRSIKNGNAYSICNTLRCCNCNLVFLDIRFSDNELTKLYKNYRGAEYDKLREFYEEDYAFKKYDLGYEINYIDQIEFFIEKNSKLPQKVLDWGGDSGINTPFKNKASKIDVYDISGTPTLGNITKVNKLDVSQDFYDLIICSNVLEHVPYPSEVLSDIKEVMKKQTYLYIELPFEELMQNSIEDKEKLKKYWHEHINFYSKESISALLSNLELSIIEINILEISLGKKIGKVFQILAKIGN
jgi:hypothetical protein